VNLHGIVAPYVAAVNPLLPVVVQVSTGSTIGADGTRAPTYSTIDLVAQVQALTFRDLQQISGLNLQGTRRAIYLFGDIEGIVRSTVKGGDIITFPDSSIWLVAMCLENWGADGTSDVWTKVVATLQNGV
jgi:hypothetical protein